MIHTNPDIISFHPHWKGQENLTQLFFCIIKPELTFVISLRFMQRLQCWTAHWLAHYATAMINTNPDIISFHLHWYGQENLTQLFFCLIKPELRFVISLRIPQRLCCWTAHWLEYYARAMIHTNPGIISFHPHWKGQENLTLLIFCLIKPELRFVISLRILQRPGCTVGLHTDLHIMQWLWSIWALALSHFLCIG